MSYGTLKVDNITYTNAGVDASTSVSGLVQGQFPNLTITGTISGATITGNTGNFTTITAVTGIFTSTLSGATTTGITANFQSGVFTTQVSGATVAGPTHTGTTANFISGVFTTRVSGAIVTGDAGEFTNITGGGAGFTSVTGTTITGTTVNANSANFTNTVTGATFSGTTVNAVSANFTTSVTGVTVTGTTANFASGVFTTQVSGATVAGPTHTGTTANFSSGNFTGTLSGTTTRDGIGNVRSIPQNSQTSGYTLQASDVGKHVFTATGVTVPSGVFTVGDAVSIYNNSASNITITQGTNVTLRQAGASGTGDRTLAQRGLATVLCVSGAAGTEFVIGGAGLS